MISARRFFRALFERRTKRLPVDEERRQPRANLKDAEQCVTDSIENLSRTIRMKRPDLLKLEAVNDVQNIVQFKTFAQVCSFRIPNLTVRLCRHPRHESANAANALCDELMCPFVKGTA